jgi:sec-independent protein translocase protein TatB
MFDISWTEFLLIGVVALVVIGPKELPGVMRTMGQWTRKVRGMAAEFQNQFQEAMREAEMADLKKQVDDMARDVKDIDPLKGVRDDIESVGKDVERSLASTPEQTAALPEANSEPALIEPPLAEPAPVPAETAPASVAEAPAPPLPETIEKAEQADGTGRPG